MKKLTLRSFDDMHCHFRVLPLLREVALFTATYCGRAVVMPNTRPRAILSATDVMWYKGQIEKSLGSLHSHHFRPLMTIEVRDVTTPAMVEEARKAGAVAGKVYPLGTTTNSDKGLKEFFSAAMLETFRAMQKNGMLLLLHGELDLPRTLFTKREEVFLPTLVKLAEKFPDLNIVLEHVSTKKGVALVKSMGNNVAATITVHHPLLTLNDCRLNPHNICNPTPNDFGDREALLEAMTSGNRKFFLGSDSAPHLRKCKECATIACGVFTAPMVPQVLAEIFETAGKLEKLEDFTSRFGAEFYGLPLNEGTITLIKEAWTVPLSYGSVVPFMAGQKLQWQLC